MDREFRSAVGWWYYLAMMIGAGCTVLAFLQSNIWVIIGMLALMTLIIHVFLNTWYLVTAGDELVVHCSFFPEKRIAIKEINAIEPSSMPVSSYALSLDRLIIYTDDKPWMLISPKNKKEFVQLLRNINSEIEIRN